MKNFEITYFRNDEKVNTETIIATDILRASEIADETCNNMNKIDAGEDWTFSLREIAE